MCVVRSSLSPTVHDIGVLLDSRHDTALTWCSARLQCCAAGRARWSAGHDDRIATTPLVAREVPHWLQASRHCVSRATRSKAGVRRLVNHTGLRSADSALLAVTRYNLERHGPRSFSRAAPTLWNALPEDLRSKECMNKFKTRHKSYYFKIAFYVLLYNTFHPFIFLFIYLFLISSTTISY